MTTKAKLTVTQDNDGELTFEIEGDVDLEIIVKNYDILEEVYEEGDKIIDPQGRTIGKIEVDESGELYACTVGTIG